MPSHSHSEPKSGTRRQTLRRSLRAQRRSLAPRTQRQNAQAVARAFFRSRLSWQRGTVAAYLPNDGELNPLPLMLRLHRLGWPLALPVVKDRSLTFFRWQPGAPMTRNRFGIEEPNSSTGSIDTRSIRLMLVPLVAVDDHGNRLGMGAGFYDRHLAGLAPRLRPHLIGLAHDLQRTAAIPAQPWDIPLQAVITERGILSFGPWL